LLLPEAIEGEVCKAIRTTGVQVQSTANTRGLHGNFLQSQFSRVFNGRGGATPMTLLHLVDVHLSYGPHEVLRGVDLQLNAGARVGLVGPNGTGKTSLLRVATGELIPDHGEVRAQRSVNIRLLRQERAFGGHTGTPVTVLEFALRARQDLVDLERRLHVLQARVAEHHDDAEALKELGAVTDRFEHEGGYALRARAQSVLQGLGLPREKWEQPAASLSGGEAGRLELASILIQQPDLLLLDEPTNHLDMAATEFLEGWLREFKGAVLLVSHDRAFLDNAVNQIAEMRNGKIEHYTGGYSAYAVERELRAARRLKAFELQQDFIKKTELWIAANIVSATSTMKAKSRRKMLGRLDRVEAPDSVRKVAKLAFPGGMRTVEVVLQAKGLTHGFGDRTLFSGLDLILRRGEKVGVAGPNGAGKSTLGRILAGRIEQRAGEVMLGRKVEMLYYDQGQADLPTTGTAFSMVRDAHRLATNEELRGHLARFGFSGAESEKEVKSMSGGERARLQLALATLSPANFLILDEPTNHLDLDTREALEDALESFEGTVLIISHDRYLLDAITDRTIIVADGKVIDEPGNYSEVRERQIAVEKAEAQTVTSSGAPVRETAAQAHKRGEKEQRARERELKRVEERISTLETGIAERDAVMATPDTPWKQLSDAQKERDDMALELEALMASWETLSTALAE